MVFNNWILPILIGVVASYVLLSILYNNPYIKSKFMNLGTNIYLQKVQPNIINVNTCDILTRKIVSKDNNDNNTAQILYDNTILPFNKHVRVKKCKITNI